MKLILSIALCLFATVAQAQTTVETAFILRTMIVPTADGAHSVSGMPVIKITYAECEAMVIEAEAAMHAVEDDAVALFDRTSWTHKSFAGCLRVQMTVQIDPTVTTQTPVLCVREYNSDWFAPCP